MQEYKIEQLDLSPVPNLAKLQCQCEELDEIDITSLKYLKVLTYEFMAFPPAPIIQRSDQDFQNW